MAQLIQRLELFDVQSVILEIALCGDVPFTETEQLSHQRRHSCEAKLAQFLFEEVISAVINALGCQITQDDTFSVDFGQPSFSIAKNCEPEKIFDYGLKK